MKIDKSKQGAEGGCTVGEMKAYTVSDANGNVGIKQIEETLKRMEKKHDTE